MYHAGCLDVSKKTTIRLMILDMASDAEYIIVSYVP